MNYRQMSIKKSKNYGRKDAPHDRKVSLGMQDRSSTISRCQVAAATERSGQACSMAGPQKVIGLNSVQKRMVGDTLEDPPQAIFGRAKSKPLLQNV